MTVCAPPVLRRLGVLVAIVAGVALAGGAASAQEPDGEQVYQANCAQCHQPGGTGLPGLFPPLKGNENVQDAEYVRNVVSNGLAGEIVVNGETYNAQMPAIALSDAELDALITFLQGDLQAMEEPTTTTLAPEETVADLAFEEAAAAGKELFGGWERLENGGPACVSCHAAGDFTGLFGPMLGPGLAGQAAASGETAGLAERLAAPHADRMATLYENDPLTADERARLAAFLASQEGRAEGGPIPDGLLVMGLGGLLLLVGFAFAFGFRGSRNGERR